MGGENKGDNKRNGGHFDGKKKNKAKNNLMINAWPVVLIANTTSIFGVVVFPSSGFIIVYTVISGVRGLPR